VSGALAASGLEQDYRYCETLAARHYENFTVIARFMPAVQRRAMAAVYAFCRGVDNAGDEGPVALRPAALDQWEAELHRCYQGQPSQPGFLALADTIARFRLPEIWFVRLIEANRWDQVRHRYDTFEELLQYCRLSAEPVGRLVLALNGIFDEERGQLSDRICTALQLANFWQDIGDDLDRGRIYVPLADLERFGAQLDDFMQRQMTPAIRATMAFEVARTEAWFHRGQALERLLPWRLKLQVRLYRLGGQAILNALKRQHFDAFLHRPRVNRLAKMELALRALVG
jgi:squalene synthase HpnC